jgi:hypothetical protein
LDTKAMLDPSGRHCGPVSRAAAVVSARIPVPSTFTTQRLMRVLFAS